MIVLMADSEKKLQMLVSVFSLIFGRRKMKVNVKMNKVTWCNSIGRKHILVSFNVEPLKKVDCFQVFGDGCSSGWC